MNSSVFRRDLNVPKVLPDLVDRDRENLLTYLLTYLIKSRCSCRSFRLGRARL